MGAQRHLAPVHSRIKRDPPRIRRKSILRRGRAYIAETFEGQ